VALKRPAWSAVLSPGSAARIAACNRSRVVAHDTLYVYRPGTDTEELRYRSSWKHWPRIPPGAELAHCGLLSLQLVACKCRCPPFPDGLYHTGFAEAPTIIIAVQRHCCGALPAYITLADDSGSRADQYPSHGSFSRFYGSVLFGHRQLCLSGGVSALLSPSTSIKRPWRGVSAGGLALSALGL